MDQRWQQLGDLMVNYSTAVKPDERVMIAMSEVDSYPLAYAIYAAAIKAGAYPQIQFLSESLRHLVLKYGNEQQLRCVPEIESYGMDWADVYFGLRGGYNLYEHADIDSANLTANQYAVGRISSLRWQETRWCLARVPNALFAQQAESDLETITDMFFDACLLDWGAESRRLQERAKSLDHGKIVRILGQDTDLTDVCGKYSSYT